MAAAPEPKPDAIAKAARNAAEVSRRLELVVRPTIEAAVHIAHLNRGIHEGLVPVTEAAREAAKFNRRLELAFRPTAEAANRIAQLDLAVRESVAGPVAAIAERLRAQGESIRNVLGGAYAAVEMAQLDRSVREIVAGQIATMAEQVRTQGAAFRNVLGESGILDQLQATTEAGESIRHALIGGPAAIDFAQLERQWRDTVAGPIATMAEQVRTQEGAFRIAFGEMFATFEKLDFDRMFGISAEARAVPDRLRLALEQLASDPAVEHGEGGVRREFAFEKIAAQIEELRADAPAALPAAHPELPRSSARNLPKTFLTIPRVLATHRVEVDFSEIRATWQEGQRLQIQTLTAVNQLVQTMMEGREAEKRRQVEARSWSSKLRGFAEELLADWLKKIVLWVSAILAFMMGWLAKALAG